MELVDEPSSSNSITVSIVLGVLIPIIVIIIIVSAVVIYNKRKEHPNNGTTTHIDPQTTTSHHTTAHQTLQTAAPPANTNLAFSQPQQFYPTTYMQTEMYPTGSHHSANPTVPPYSSGQFTFAPAQSSIPSGTLQPSCVPVIQGQQQAGALDHVPSLFLNTTGNAPPSMPSVAISPSAPPPPYQDVINS